MVDLGFIYELLTSDPRPGLHPIPGTNPLTIEAAICPPLLYYVALLFLPPGPPDVVDTFALTALRNVIATLAGILFFRLPLAYHVPQSIGLTYQLSLVGLYGGCRVLDAFFISPYLFGHIPKRVKYEHHPRVETPMIASGPGSDRAWSDGGVSEPFLVRNKTYQQSVSASKRDSQLKGLPPAPQYRDFATIKSASSSAKPSPTRSLTTMMNDSYLSLSRTMSGPHPVAVTEFAQTEVSWPHDFVDRASWALELELSMRGIGFTWTTADVRHTRKTWLPTVGNRVHSILVHVLPIQIVSWAIIKSIYTTHLLPHAESPSYDPLSYKTEDSLFDTHLSTAQQLLLTAALGAFLMSAFSLGHSLFAILLHPLSPSPLAFFPPLYTRRVWSIKSVRQFWSFGWHRLFARLFLVYGVWPGEYLERKITSKPPTAKADIGKVLGGFLSSAFVHSFAVRSVLGGKWGIATGEARFFALNGLAVVFEEAIIRVVKSLRRRNGWQEKSWWDGSVGRTWWITVLLFSGRNFARGWVRAGLVREMALM